MDQNIPYVRKQKTFNNDKKDQNIWKTIIINVYVASKWNIKTHEGNLSNLVKK